MPTNLENLAVVIELEKVSVHSNAKECSNYRTCVLSCFSHVQLFAML